MKGNRPFLPWLWGLGIIIINLSVRVTAYILPAGATLSAKLRGANIQPTMSLYRGMYVIGLTGGIAAGKSQACTVLERLGARVLDADKLGHSIYLPGTVGFSRVTECFGSDIIAPDGTIDRKKLGAKVFSNDEEMKKLTGIVWPLIAESAKEKLAEFHKEKCTWAVMEAAVLLEANWDSCVDEVWCMMVSRETAIERIIFRNQISAEEAQKRINSQMSNDERRARSRLVIDSSGTIEETAVKLKQAVRDLAVRVKENHGFELVINEEEV